MKKFFGILSIIAILTGCASTGGSRSAEEDCRLGNEAGSAGVGAVFGPIGAVAGYGVGKLASNVRCK